MWGQTAVSPAGCLLVSQSSQRNQFVPGETEQVKWMERYQSQKQSKQTKIPTKKKKKNQIFF